jgi:hypothetical protein
LARPPAPGRLRILEPSLGQDLQPGELRLRVTAPDGGGRTAEVLAAWNSDPSGVTPIVSCRVPLEQLVDGVRAPPEMTRGRLGGFTFQARVVEPYEGPLSAPVDVRIVKSPSSAGPGHLAPPVRPGRIMARPAPAPVGNFACSG